MSAGAAEGEGTVRLYDSDAYQTEFASRVLSCEPRGERFALVLEETAFFPESGGQTSDRGRLIPPQGEAAAVLDAQIDEETGIVTHLTDRWVPPGTEVRGFVDWGHRFDNMQQHTGEHIFSGLACGRFGCTNVGFHLSDETVTMDYDRALAPEEIAGIEAAANEAIWRDLPVEVSFLPEDARDTMAYRSKKEIRGTVRVVTIPGIDVCACCAPHVRRTGEVGLLKVLSVQNYKGGVRVSIACGKRALSLLSARSEILTGMARGLSTAPEEVPGQLEKLRQELSAAKRQVSELGETALGFRIRLAELRPIPRGAGTKDTITSDTITDDIIADDAGRIIVFDPLGDAGAARRALNAWAGSREGLCGVFLGDGAEGYPYLIAAGQEADARIPQGLLAQRLGAKGGGSQAMVQGRVRASREEIVKVWEELS